MKINSKLIVGLIFFNLWANHFLLAQKKNNYVVDREVSLKGDSIEERKHPETAYKFHNLGKINYYRNEAELKEIRKFEESKNFEELLPALQNYILNFGAGNFNKDTDLLWKLAQLHEFRGNKEEAIFFYKIVLKHERIFSLEARVRKHYDTLNINNEDSWVPLKHYYELVEYRKAIDTLRPPVGVFINMGDNVNSRFDDYGPAMHVNGKYLIFTRRVPIEKSFDPKLSEDLYFTQNDDGFWNEAELMKKLNTPYNEGSACISRDGLTVYFAKCMAPDGMGDCDIYYTQLNPKDTSWSPPQNLGFHINSRSWDSQPALSHSEDTLYFASDRLGGFGLSDIYYCVKNKGGEWGTPINMGPIVNTSNNEVSPFMHPTYNVLYFSSNGHLLNFGEFDIYRTRCIDGVWIEPKNVGPLVNGKGNEYYFTIDSEAKNLYYSRAENDDNTNLDLYSFPLPMEAQPNAITSFKGTLSDSATGKSFDGIVSMIDLTNGIEIAPKNIHPDGSFEFDLIDNADYLLIIQGDDFFRIEQKMHIEGDTTIHIKTPSIKFKKLQFATLEFERDKANITPFMYSDLDKLFDFLIDNPDFKLIISGHTDKSGDPNVNRDLSQRRADAIKEYLAATKGDFIKKSRIKAIGYGSSKPIVKEELTDADHKLNRRVEFQVVRPGDEEYEGF